MAKMEFRPPQFARGVLAKIDAEASARARPEANPLMRTFMQLKPGECRFAYGEEAPFLFCAQPAENGQSYCAAHCAACLRPVGAPPRADGTGSAQAPRENDEDDEPNPVDAEIAA